MADHTLALRDAGIVQLQSFAAVTAIVPAARIYPSQPPDAPAWPWIRWGRPIVSRPTRAEGMEIINYELVVHCFARETEDEGGEDICTRLAAAVVRALDDQDLQLDSEGGLILLLHSQTQVIRDTAEAGGYHAIVQFNAATAEVVAPASRS